METQTPILVATGLLALFAALAFFDGVYLHLWKYRLHERSTSQYEHRTHTLSALLFVPGLILTYAVNSGGWLLWLAIGLATVQFLVEGADALSERESRVWQGGLKQGEYVLHLSIVTVRVASLTLMLVSKPGEAWALSSPWVLSSAYPELTSWVAWNMVPGAVLVAALHVALVRYPNLLSCCPQLDHGKEVSL